MTNWMYKVITLSLYYLFNMHRYFRVNNVKEIYYKIEGTFSLEGNWILIVGGDHQMYYNFHYSSLNDQIKIQF